MNNKLREMVEKNRIKCRYGKLADYIPGLDNANKESLGLCIHNLDGSIIKIGDFNTKFTIQSVSKPVVLMLAILDNGVDYVFSKVGMEPSGDAFNSIKKLETSETSKPFNPMINAGAISTTAMVKGKDGKEKFERILDFFKIICENDTLEIDEEIYAGEKETGNRNRAMSYFMKSEGFIEGEAEASLDAYFKQCSILVTAEDLAKIGAFLARGGVLSTGERIVSDHIAKIVKTLMTTCGMYDGSGEFALTVGIPSKSGVAGGICSVVPGKMGIGVYGPSLDKKGNSIGGSSLLKDISQEFSLSIF